MNWLRKHKFWSFIIVLSVLSLGLSFVAGDTGIAWNGGRIIGWILTIAILGKIATILGRVFGGHKSKEVK